MVWKGTAFAGVIVDTGASQAYNTSYWLSTSQWLAAEYELGSDSYITGLYGWMTNQGNTGQNFTISIYGDGGEVPDTGSLLYSNSGSISGTNTQANWEGYDITWTDPLGNTGLFLSAGTYWIAFELRTINYNNPYDGNMPLAALNPLDNYAFNPGRSWIAYDDLQLGVQILGNPAGAAPVPEPATALLLGLGLAGFVGGRKRLKKQ
jgi:hypothetical protein